MISISQVSSLHLRLPFILDSTVKTNPWRGPSWQTQGPLCGGGGDMKCESLAALQGFSPSVPPFLPMCCWVYVATSWQTLISLLPTDVDWRFDLELFADGFLQNPGQQRIQTSKVRKSQELQRPIQKRILESHSCECKIQHRRCQSVFITSDETWNITQFWIPELRNIRFMFTNITLCLQTLIHYWMQRTWKSYTNLSNTIQKTIPEPHCCKYKIQQSVLVTTDEIWNITQFWLPELTNIKFTVCLQTLIHYWIQKSLNVCENLSNP